MTQRIKHFIYLIILLMIDQGSKLWVKRSLMNQDPFVIIPDVFKFQYHENTGAVWGILSGQVDFLKIFTLIIFLFISFVYFKIPKDKKYNPLKILAVFILAGAAGNLIDRFYLCYVVDFIYFELIDFPLFNIADSYLVVASILLFILSVFYYKDEDFAFLEQLLKKKKQAEDNEVGRNSSLSASDDDSNRDDSNQA